MDTLIINAETIGGMDQIHGRFYAAFNFPECYGENLDALWDVLTEPEQKEKRFRILPPDGSADEDVRGYASKMENVFRLAGALAE